MKKIATFAVVTLIVSTLSAHAQSMDVLNDCHELRLMNDSDSTPVSHAMAYSCFDSLIKATHEIVAVKSGSHAKQVDQKQDAELVDQVQNDAAFFATLITEKETHSAASSRLVTSADRQIRECLIRGSARS